MTAKQREFFAPDLSPEKTIRLAVSGDVHVTKTELKIIDSPEFQRLRRMKQLGTSYLVYPTATHTRFEHSLGTLKMSSLIVEMIRKSVRNGKSAIDIGKSDEQIVRLAALLHDITTIPFGHSLEDETTVIESDHESPERYEHFLGQKVINETLQKSLGSDGCNLLKKVLHTRSTDIYSLGDKAYMCDIVKNTICADLLDYLRRDALYCDLRSDFGDRFLKFLYIAEVMDTEVGDVEVSRDAKPKKAKRLVTRLWKEKERRHRRDLIDELVQLLSARFLLSSAVYFHHAKIVTSAMIGRAVKRALQENIVTEDKILYELGDDELLYILGAEGKGEIANLTTALRGRDLYKIFDGYAISREQAEAQETPVNLLQYFESTFNRNANNRIRTEDMLSEDCKRSPGDILIYCPRRDMSLKEANMIVLWKGVPQPLKKIDDGLVRSKIDNITKSHEQLWSLRLLVHPHIDDKIRTASFRPHLLEDCCKLRIEGDEEGSTRKLDAAVENIVMDIQRTGTRPVPMEEIRKFAHKAARRGQPPTRKEIEKFVNNSRNKRTKNERSPSK